MTGYQGLGTGYRVPGTRDQGLGTEDQGLGTWDQDQIMEVGESEVNVVADYLI